jgi:signal transduction histidine kinase
LDATAPVAATPASPLRWFLAAPPKVLLVLVMTAVVSIIVLGVSELTAGRVNEIRNEAAAARDTAAHVSMIRDRVAQAESAQRGYLLTSDPRYLLPLRAAEAAAQKSYVQLTALTQEHPGHAERSRSLVRLSTSKFDEMRLAVQAQEQGRHEHAMTLLRTGLGVQMMEDLVKQADEFEASALELFGERQAAVTRALNQQRIGLGVVVFINLLFLAVLANMTIRQFSLREAHRAELEAQAAMLERQVNARTEELSSLSSHLQQSTEREKSRLARDLHDELGGILTSAKIDIAWLEGHSKSADPEVVPRLQRLAATVDEAVNMKRRVVEDLRPSLLDHLGLGAALNWYVNETCKKAGLQCRLKLLSDAETVPPEIAIAIYRLVQEGLTNILKHAQATEIEVELQRKASGYKLRLTDNGLGITNFRPDQLSHGIAGMRQRARALGGGFDLRTTPGEGTTIEAFFPLTREVP